MITLPRNEQEWIKFCLSYDLNRFHVGNDRYGLSLEDIDRWIWKNRNWIKFSDIRFEVNKFGLYSGVDFTVNNIIDWGITADDGLSDELFQFLEDYDVNNELT